MQAWEEKALERLEGKAEKMAEAGCLQPFR